MGAEKQTSQTASQTQYTPTEEEKAMQKLQLGQYEQTVGPQTEAQLSGLDLVNRLLTGQQLPDWYQNLQGGISPEAIGAQATQLTQQNMPGMQGLGILESGSAMRSISQDIANQLLFPAEQFNIGAKQNLLNLALSGSAQVQQPIMQGQSILSNQLAGLRTVNQTGSSTQKSMNPFLKSFQTSFGTQLGSTLGGGNISAGSTSWLGF